MDGSPEGFDGTLAGELRSALDAALAGGMAKDPVAHAGQVAAIMTVLDRAFRADGLRCVLVGGAAIEVHAPGMYVSHDIDLVIDALYLPGRRARIGRVFSHLDFAQVGRHWERGGLYVEVPGTYLEDPAEPYTLPPWRFTVVTKEVLLRDRLVGFKYWGQITYGAQAFDMVRAFGGSLDMAWLAPQLRRENVQDVFEALRAHVTAGVAPTDARLERLLAQVRGSSVDGAVADWDE